MEQEIIKKIKDELSLCYECIGRKTPGSITIVAVSIQDAINFSTVEQVHEIFKRAKDIEAIPSQKTLKECFKNYGEERLKYRGENNGTAAIGHDDPRSNRLPKDDRFKRLNLMTAIKNYCVAVGGDMYYRYCECHLTRQEKRGDKIHIFLENPEKANAFDAPIKDYLRYLYPKYWRSLPQAQGYPEEPRLLNLGLTPPTIEQFKRMLINEGVLNDEL